MTLRSLAASECTTPPTLTIEQVTVRMRCCTKFRELGVGQVVEISIVDGREDLWLLFGGDSRATGPFRLSDLFFFDPGTEEPANVDELAAQEWAAIQAEYERLYFWRNGWKRADEDRERPCLQSHSEYLERRWMVANRRIANLMKKADVLTARLGPMVIWPPSKESLK